MRDITIYRDLHRIEKHVCFKEDKVKENRGQAKKKCPCETVVQNVW